MSEILHPVYIDGIAFDALIDSSEDYSASIPSYTTEKGFNTSDTIILEQFSLSMTLYIAESPVTWRNNGTGKEHVRSVVSKLRELYEKRTLVTVTTNDDVFTNMAIESMTISRDVDNGYSREVPISLKQVRVTETNTATIPSSYYYSGTTSTSTGNTNTEEDGIPSSLALNLFTRAGVNVGSLIGG